jgi:hypothetical protein
MSERAMEAAREALAATVAGVLRRHARRSVHPADQAALHHAAAQIARALQAEFRLVARHASAAELSDRERLSAPVHE